MPIIHIKDDGQTSKYADVLNNSGEIRFFENLTYVMMHTSYREKDLMEMPIKKLYALIKEIRIAELSQNPEWREEYLKQLAEENILKNKALAQTKMDVSALKSFLGTS